MPATWILGISAFYHDSAACLLRDGDIVAAAQEERFTRKKGDAGFPTRAVEYCLAGRWDRAIRSRLRRLLRQAAAQVRAHSRDLPFSVAPWISVVPEGRAALDEGEAVHRARAACGTGGVRGGAALRRAPRIARGQRLLPVAVRVGGDPDDGWRRRVGHRVDRCRARQRDRAPQGAALARLARSALLRVHLLHRVQGQLRRVQGDGPRAVRRSRSTST